MEPTDKVELTDEQKATMKRQVADVKPEDEERVRRDFEKKAAEAKDKIKDPGFWDGIRTLWSMLKDPDYTVSWQTKAWIIFALTYFISPIDLIPDIIPVVGYADDVAVVLWVLHVLHEDVVAYRKFKGLAPAS